MKINFKLLKAGKVMEKEVDENQTVDSLIPIIREMFNIKEEGVIKFIYSNQLLSNQKTLIEQRLNENALVIVNFRAAKKIDAQALQVQVAPVAQQAEENDEKTWYPRTYSEVINNTQSSQKTTSPSQQPDESHEIELPQINRGIFPGKYTQFSALSQAEAFAIKLEKNSAPIDNILQNPVKKQQLQAFFGDRVSELTTDMVQQLCIQSVRKFNINVQNDEDKAFEEQQFQMLREMGELNDQFDQLPEIDDKIDAPANALNFDELRIKYASQLQQIKDMGVALDDNEILQMLEIAGGSVEVVINQVFGM